MGFLVNPIAGMGGRVGLKGTDGVLDEAIELGAKPVAPNRAKEFLTKLKEFRLDSVIRILACPAIMGREEVTSVGLSAEILSMRLKSENTTAKDTKKAVKLMIEREVDLIVFVGGDGTARDILDAMRESKKLPVLGVPSGVKMYSGIFAVNPSEAANVVKAFVEDEAQIMDFEIIDADEKAIRGDSFSISLYGFMKGPFVPLRLQGSKQVSSESLEEHENQMSAARFIFEEMNPAGTYLLCPGTTVKCVADLLNVEKTLLGVDIYFGGRIVQDVNEKKILQWVKDWENTWIIVSPIGRQGILFGRGNQQISPKIIKLVGKESVIVIATRNKIKSIDGSVLRVDTGELEVDDLLRGYIKVVTDYREWTLMRVV
jgi:predicted polyphosphate/ATP-dependent NAD kinase